MNLIGEGLTWQASADQDWVVLSTPSGLITTVENDEVDDFNISIDPTNLSPGRHEAVVTVTADADQSMTIPLTVEVGAQMLSVSKRGIAFTDTPDVSLLQTSVEIGVNVERTAEWSASSNVGWLTVTPSGTTNDSMFITADTASLANEVISEAVITISSSETEITSDETIALALWKSIEPPTNQPIDFVLDFQGADVLSDPIRPYAYVQTMGNLLNVINVYSGILVDTITLENDFTDFDISDDGTFLYAVRSGDGEGFIDAVNLSAALVETTWAYPVERLSAGTMQKISFGRVAGHPSYLPQPSEY